MGPLKPAYLKERTALETKVTEYKTQNSADEAMYNQKQKDEVGKIRKKLIKVEISANAPARAIPSCSIGWRQTS